MKKVLFLNVFVLQFFTSSVLAQKKIDSLNLLLSRAVVFKNDNKFDEAIDVLKNLNNIKPLKKEDYNAKIDGLLLLCSYIDLSKSIENKQAVKKDLSTSTLGCINNAMKEFPKEMEFYFKRGKLNMSFLSLPDSALKDLNKYILAVKNNPEAYKLRAAIFLDPSKLNYKNAINDYSKLILIDTSNKKLYLENRAECYFKARKLDSAILDYSFLINRYKEMAHYEKRGDAFIELKKYQAGINDYGIIITDRITRKEVRLKRANAYFNNNNLDTAHYEYTNIKMEFDMFKLNKEIAITVNKIYGTKLTALDIDKSDKFLDIAKNDILWPAMLKSADDYKYYNQIKEALSNSIKANPYEYNAHFWLAEIEYTIANYTAAKKNYLAAHAIMPLNTEFLFRANKSEAAIKK